MVFDQGDTGKEKSKRNNGREDFDVNREQRETDHMRDHQQTVGQQHTEGPALNNGRRALSHKNPGDNSAAQKKKEEDEKAIRFALKQAQMAEEMADLNRRLGEIETMQEGINHQLEAIKNGEGVELDENGNLKNKDAEKALREYEEKYGSVDRTDPEAVQRALVRYNDELTKERDEVRQKLVELRNQEQDTTIAKKNLLHQGINLDFKQVETQEHKNIETTIERDEYLETEHVYAGLHDELRDFMMAYAKVKKIPDPRERMEREQEIVKELSPEAKNQLSNATGVDHLFTPDYFKPLSEAEPAIKSAEENLSSIPTAKT